MGRADLAGLFEALAQLPPRAMQPDFQISARNAHLPSHRLCWLAVEIGELQHLRILRPYRRQQCECSSACTVGVIKPSAQ